MVISVVIPTLNAAAHLPRSLPPLVAGVLEGVVKEVIIADGGSIDATLEIADAAGCVVVQAQKGRGAQLMHGAAAARADWLLFLHADTALDDGWQNEARRAMQAHPMKAGYFRFTGDDDSAQARTLAFWVRLRCALFALPYGDQGLLISRELYQSVGGYRPLQLMEDVDLVRRLGRARLTALATPARTSLEKHRRDGFNRRAAKNLFLLLRFLMGADPNRLAQHYD